MGIVVWMPGLDGLNTRNSLRASRCWPAGSWSIFDTAYSDHAAVPEPSLGSTEFRPEDISFFDFMSFITKQKFVN